MCKKIQRLLWRFLNALQIHPYKYGHTHFFNCVSSSSLLRKVVKAIIILSIFHLMAMLIDDLPECYMKTSEAIKYISPHGYA